MTKKAWILDDKIAGNKTQTTALAESLNLDYEIKTIEYNCLAKLPNILIFGLMHIDKEKSDDLMTCEMPDVIISAGRRCALVAAYLKKRSGNKIKIINIMRPQCYESLFDYIILPNHDTHKAASNVLTIDGALNCAQEKIKTSPDLKSLYPEIKEFFGVIIGGNTRLFEFSTADDQKLVNLVNEFLLKTKLSPVITFSRRTNNSTKDLIRKSFPQSIIYDPEKSPQNNIYYSILKSAKYVICTGESVSMCSEVASSGKPLYVYLPEYINKSAKITSFINQLLDKKIARILDNYSNIEEYSYEPWNEVARIAKLIKV